MLQSLQKASQSVSQLGKKYSAPTVLVNSLTGEIAVPLRELRKDTSLFPTDSAQNNFRTVAGHVKRPK